MKKKNWIPIVIVALLAILVIPIPTGVYKDGGTREYTALTYKIVDWNRMTGDATYDETKVYFFPYNFKSIDGLWYYEKDKVEHSFIATVLEINGSSVTVQPVGDSALFISTDKVSFGTSELEKIEIGVGSVVKVNLQRRCDGILSGSGQCNELETLRWILAIWNTPNSGLISE